VFLERNVVSEESVHQLVDIDVVSKQVGVERRDQQLDTVSLEVVLRIALLCTHQYTKVVGTVYKNLVNLILMQ